MNSSGADIVSRVPNQGWDERVIVVRCGALVDVFVVVGDRYVVLVDTLLNPATATALLEIAREHLTGGRQLLVVNTHADWDHAWGNQVFAGPEALLQAPIIASRACAERLRSPEDQENLRNMREQEPERFGAVRLTPPTILFAEWLAIDAGGLTLELLATPGHTRDHIAVYIPEISMLLAGDAAEAPFPLVETAADLPVLRGSLAKMAALNPSHALYCHAPVTSGSTLLRDNLAHFDDLERRCRAALGRGVPARPDAAEDVEALVSYPFAEAIPAGLDLPPDWNDLYRTMHRTAIRAMLEYCADNPASSQTT